MSSYAHSSSNYVPKLNTSSKGKGKDKDSRDDGKKSPKAMRPKNPLPCYDCSKAKVRCDTENQPPGLCLRCHRRGLKQCPPHVPWSMRPGTQYPPSQYSANVAAQEPALLQATLPQDSSMVNPSTYNASTTFSTASTVGAQPVQPGVAGNYYSYQDMPLYPSQPTGPSTNTHEAPQGVYACPFHTNGHPDNNCIHCYRWYYYNVPQ